MSVQAANPRIALGWVREELENSLGQIRVQLENVARSGASGPALSATRNNLEQLRLTFDALVLPGASILSGEMTAVCDGIAEDRVKDRDAALSALMDALVVLPSYLDRLQAGHHDLPILLLPVINDLRTANDRPLLTEGTLFAPELDVDLPELEAVNDEDAAEAFDELANRLRRQYESALLNWLQDQDDASRLEPLGAVCETLQRRLQRVELRRMWWVANEIIAGICEGNVANDLPLRRLFARLHLVLKKLAEAGEAGVDAEEVESLSQALLYHAAQAPEGNSRIDRLRDRFELQRLIPDRGVLVRARGAITGRNRELFESLGTAVHEELGQIKDTLDLELRTGNVDAERREASLEGLRRLQETLGMMGLSDVAESFQHLLPAWRDSEHASGDREEALMALAQQLIRVESEVDAHIETLGEPLPEEEGEQLLDLPRHEMRRTRTTVLNEIIRSLHAVQEGMRASLDGDEKADYRGGLEHISGAFILIDQADLARRALDLKNALERLMPGLRMDDPAHQPHLELATDAVAAFELFLAGLRDEQENRHRFLEIMDERLARLAEALRKRAAETPLEPVAPETLETPAEEASPPADEVSAEEAPEAPAATEAAGETPAATTPSELAADGPGTLDPGLADIFLEEFDEVSGALDELLPAWRDKSDNRALLVEIRRSFHTLKGSGRMVGATELGEFAWHIEEMLNKVLESPVDDFSDLVVMVELARAALPALRQRLLGEPAELERAAIHAIAAEAERLQSGAAPDWGALKPSLPPTLVALLPDEAAAPAEKAAEAPAPAAAPEPSTPEPPADARVAELARTEFREHLATLESLQHDEATEVVAAREHVMAAHGLSGSPGLAGQSDAVVLARALEELLDLLKRQQEPLNATERDALREAIGIFHRHVRRMDGDADAPRPHGEAELVRHLHALTAQRRKRGARAPENPAGAVNEVLGFFLEEAQEVLGRCDSLLNDWRDRLGDMSLVQNLQREIHTFKGGARMAGLTALGEISHAMETLLERIANHQAEATVAAVEVLESGCDRLNTWVEQLARGETPETAKAVTLFLEQVEALDVVPGAAVAEEPEEAEAHELEELPEDELPEDELLGDEALDLDDDLDEDFEDVEEDETAEAAEADEDIEARPAPARAGREMADSAADDAPGGQQVRVAADLLDRLVNAAGEISICRSRLEQQVGSFRFNLKEFDQTVARLRDQLRKLEIETEAQILSRYQRQPEENGADFDPLELDRFSTIQQLSRALSESVADLLNLQEMLEETARHSEALLTQQSRVSNELQEGLMQARMVRFATIAPRLRRVVRAAAEETRKNARLQLRVIGTSDQLDRNVLERITAPLEHMLRNAVAHGIEKPKLRRSRRKRKDGEITITVSSEATEFVIRVEDDGNGLDLDAIRKRAVERGLADEDAELQPHQLMEFILQPGFSTSQKVTGLAGRGVGMDVVHSEIRQIGGSFEIDSKPRHGTSFTIRIPFSLAVMQAIGVTVGEQRYYIPVASVGGVSRMLPEDYRKLVEQDKPTWEFAGQSYPVLELEPLLGAAPEPLGEDNVSLLMIRAGDQRAAFRVTQLLGHREIVVKPVGPQVSSVPGILGGTISADGQVMLILDMGPLIRRGLLHGAPRVVAPAPVARRPSKPLVMVVDDSITMRKVTTRVLESQDFEVVTAKDGVDATEQLQERAPDLILLDIEMPRMDGYGVAEFVRGDPGLRDVPIMMITSRSGDKHRNRAREAGANDYMIKPYQEAELLERVAKLLGRKETVDGGTA